VGLLDTLEEGVVIRILVDASKVKRVGDGGGARCFFIGVMFQHFLSVYIKIRN